MPARPLDGSTILVAAIRARVEGRSLPFVVAIDGRTGAGKSLLAADIAPAMDALVVPTDDFYAANISDAEWEAKTAPQRATQVVDWRRLRESALLPLRAGRTATWHTFDFEAGRRPDGTFAMATRATSVAPASVVILEGAYASRPELADLLDFTVLVDVPDEERYRRLVERDGAAYLDNWRRRWQAAEDYYFEVIRPPAAFDLVVRF